MVHNMKKEINVLIISVITLCFVNINCNCSEDNNSQTSNSFTDTLLIQHRLADIIQPESPYNTNSFLIEHGGDPMFDDDSFGMIYESPIQLFQNNHRETINKLKQIVENFYNKNNFILNVITNTINKLNIIYNNTHEDDNNDIIITQLNKYINELERLNNKIKDNRSLSLDKQQLIKNNQIGNIIDIAKMTLDIMKKIDEDSKIFGSSSLFV